MAAFKNEHEREQYFTLAIASEQRTLDQANIDIDFYRRRRPGGAPGWGYYDTAAGIRSGLQNAKRRRLDAVRNLKKLRAGIPLFSVK